MYELRSALLDEGVLTLDGVRWSDGFAWCELRPTYDLTSPSCCVRYLWSSECGKGYGTALLKKLTRAADNATRALFLEVQPFWKRADGHGWCFETIRQGGLTHQQLEAWYGRHGFEKLEGKTMVRNARPPIQLDSGGICFPSYDPQRNCG